MRAGGGGAKIFFGKMERGKKDGHIGALRRGDEWVLTGKGGSREWGVGSGGREETKRRRDEVKCKDARSLTAGLLMMWRNG